VRLGSAFVAVLLALGFASVGEAVSFRASGGLSAREIAQGYKDGIVLAKPRAQMLPAIDKLEAAEGLTLRAKYQRFGHVRVIGLSSGDTVTAAVKRLMATGRYEYVEPSYIRRASVVPNDPQFSNQWALNNTGANGGVSGADIHAEAGWNTASTAPGVIVAILDSGALLTHQDLMANLWVNPTPGTVTSFPSIDPNSGITISVSETDSLNGLNAVAQSGPPADDVGHGTHVSGIVGAVGNNALGVTGIAWNVQLMELKFLGSSGSGTTADELPCIEYAISHKANLINGSFGAASSSQAEMDAIQAAGKAGIIFVCAAGNSAENIDISPAFPADYPLDNIICVGATDNRDLPVYFSNYGSGSVEIFAPGANILSTYFTNASSYEYLSGTSMASPMVAGAVALLRGKFPGDTYRETINRILNSADTNPALAGKAQTGGRLDLAKALTTAVNTPPNALFANRTVLVGLDPYTRSNNADSPASLEAGTPTIAGVAGGHSLWWQWTAPEDAMVEIDTSGTNGGQFATGGSTYPTLLGVYTGSSLSSLSLVQGNADFNTEPLEGGGGDVSYSEVTFAATAGTTYQINVQGQGTASGQTILAINTTPDNDSISSPRVLTGPSVSVLDANPNATLQPGEPEILGNRGGHSMWYSWTAPKSGTTEVSGYSYDFNPEVAVYTGSSIGSLSIVTAAAGTGDTGTATIISKCLCSFNATAGVTYLITVDGVTAQDTGEFTLSIADSRWQATTGDSVTCSPAIGPDGTVYVGSDDNSFYAINQNGTIKWSHAAGAPFDTNAAAIGPDGTIYAGSEDGKVYAFNPDGSVKWTYTVPGSPTPPLSCSPALGSNGTLYIHADDGNLYAISSAGALDWTAPAAGVSYAAPTIAPDGTIYIGTDGGFLYAFTPSGTKKWTFTTPVAGDGIFTAAAIDSSGNIYFGTLGGFFYSVEPTAGMQLWSFTVGDSVTSAPALVNGSVYFGGYDGNLYSLTTGGTKQWAYPLGTQVRASAPAVDAAGNVYIGCYDHNVYSISSGGSLVRIYASDDWVRSSPVISGTTLYFGSNDHKVYAFDLGTASAVGDWPMYQYNSRRVGRAVTDPLEITAQPVTQTVAPGSNLTLYVGATGPGPLTYQWSLNGAAIAGAVNSTYSVFAAETSDAGSYSATVTGAAGTLVTTPATVNVGVAPTPPPTLAGATKIMNLSARANVGTGGNILIAGFVIQGSGSKNVLLRGIGPALGLAPFNVAGALAQPQLTLVNSATNLTVTMATVWGGNPALAALFSEVGAFALSANSADSAVLETLPVGGYTSQVAGVNGTTGVALAEIYDADVASSTSSLVNISARADVGTGANILIAGFSIQGTQPASVLLRGIGPTLGTAPFNVSGVLAQPEIDLYDSAGTKLDTNTGWGGSPALSTAFTETGAFQLPAGSADAAMIETLPAGNYTLQLSGQNGTTGVGLVEVYLIPQ
jgi:outer membrane protein assembly factor BamB/subtilisin family serine protease